MSLKLMSLRADIKARQSYLTPRLKEVQIGHEDQAQTNFAKPLGGKGRCAMILMETSFDNEQFDAATCEWPSMGAGSTLTCAIAPGGRSRSLMRAGG